MQQTSTPQQDCVSNQSKLLPHDGLSLTLIISLASLLQVHCNGVSNGSIPNGQVVTAGDDGGGGLSDKKND